MTLSPVIARAMETVWRLAMASGPHAGETWEGGDWSGYWHVWRHGGNRSHSWRVIASQPFRDAALVYQAHARKMRQGGVRLVAPDGEIVYSAAAPLLRSRW